MPTKPSIDLAKLSYLAQFSLSPAEQAAAENDLEAIIAMIDAMGEVDIEGVEPMSHPLDLQARLRPDEVTQQVDREAYQRIAPEADAGLYLVPQVIE